MTNTKIKYEDLPTVYEPTETEAEIYKFWEDGDYFRADAKSKKPAYSIVIPPPNVTGVLHMGHALDETLQDILTRYHRMSGFETLWLPGTDHAGIATQNVVEKQLRAKGLSRYDLGREKFLEETGVTGKPTTLFYNRGITDYENSFVGKISEDELTNKLKNIKYLS